jgi:uncharacterized protein YutE (UPF0331/DUF86 family)
MVRAEVIRRRLQKLDEYLTILKGLQKYSQDEFLANPEIYGSTERFLQLAIETITDLGEHVVADLHLGETNWHSDIPNILAEKEYISSELREKWIRMIGFRNILVHDYLDINRKIVYEVLQSKLKDIQELKVFFASFL